MAMSQRTPSHWPAIFSSSPIMACLGGGVAVVELEGVRPAGEEGVAPVSQEQITPGALDPGVVLRGPGQVELGPGDIVLRVILGPGMIQGGVIRYEVEHQPEAPPPQPFPQSGQRRISSEVGDAPCTR